MKNKKEDEKIEKKIEKSEKDKIEKKRIKKEKKAKEGREKIAVIRIRGGVGINKKIKDILVMLRLYKKNWCIVVDKSPSFSGMMRLIKDYVTYGEIKKDVLDLLMKKAEKDSKGKIKPFRLNPPKGGFERKGIKVSFKSGGALGYRGEKINTLIKRML